MKRRILSFAALWALGGYILLGQTIHFQETFDAVAPGTIPAEWYLGDGGVIDQVPPLDYDSTWTVVTDYAGNTLGQGNFLFIYYNSSLGQQDTIVTDTFDASTPNGNLYLSFLTYYNYFSNDTGYVQVFDGTTWQTVKIYTNNDVGGWGPDAHLELIDITPYANPFMRVRFVWHELNDWYWAIDSITVFSGCLGPSAIDVSWLTPTSAILTYSANYDSIKVEYGPAGFTPGTGTIVTLSGISPDTITGLNWNNGYDFYVWFYCGATASVDTVFLTLCSVQSVPYTEPFDDPNLLSGCWKTNDPTTVLVGFDPACSLDSGYLQLWGSTGSYAESPYILVTPGNTYIVSYYYRAGDGSCGETPDGGDQVVVEWFDTAWHQLALYDGGNAPNTWTPELFTICPATSAIKFRILIVNGSGASFDSWQFDSLKVTLGPTSPDVKVVSVSNVGLACGSTGVDTFIVAYTNYGAATDTVWVELTTPAGTQTVVVDYTAQGGFGGCNDLNNIDTVVITGNITSLGVVPIKVFAKGISDADVADTVGLSFPYGEMWVYIDINTVDFGSEIYWKLFYMPDSILVKEVSAGTYASNSSYTDSFCLIPGETYRFEAWDSWGDGWNGGTYQIYALSACGDTIVYANNNGLTPDNGTSGSDDLESIEYFVVYDPTPSYNVKLVDILQPNQTLSCSGPLLDSVVLVVKNSGVNLIDTVYLGFSVGGNTVTTFKDYTGIGGLQSCAYDTIFIDTISLGLGYHTLYAWAYGNIDSLVADDTLTTVLTVGDRWVYIGINTQSWGSEVYWKLFYIPDSILVKEVPPNTYVSNSSYVDSFCAVTGATYRFEAWDDFGDGWNGGTYQIYSLICGDTIVFANNGGVSPDGLGNLEAVEYFVVAGTDVKTVEVLQPDTTACVGKPVNISVVTSNYFETVVQGDVYVNFSPIGTGTLKDTLFTNISIGACADTLNVVVYDVASGSYILTVAVTVTGDVLPDNDTITIDTLLLIDSIPTAPLGQANITICAKDTPVVLDANISGYNPVTYSWNTGNTGPIINVNSSGTYVVTITYGPGCVLIDSAIVTINPSPQASIIGPDIVDANVPNTYNASPTGTNYTYQWNTGDTTATITYTTPTPGKDTLWVIVTNEFGCTDTAYKVIEVITGVESALAYGYQLRYHQVEAIAQVITGKDLIEWVEVRDVAGRTIERRMVGDRDVTLSLRSLPRGTYFVVVKGQQAGTIVYKLLR